MIAKTGSRFGRRGTEALIDLESTPSRSPSGSTACWSALSSRPEGRRQLDPPERAALVHWPLRAHEAGSVPAEDPDGGVVRLLADKRRDQTHEAAELDLDVEAACLVRSAAGRERVLPRWSDHELHQPRLRCCLLYTSDAADDLLCVDLGGRRII